MKDTMHPNRCELSESELKEGRITVFGNPNSPEIHAEIDRLRGLLKRHHIRRGSEQVVALAEAMLEKLAENGHKGWPEKADTLRLLKELAAETMELHDALARGDAHEIRREAADVACYAMFIADVAGAL